MRETVERERRYICGLSKAKAERQDVEIYSYNPACQECRQYDRDLRNPPPFRGTPEPQKNHNAKASRRWFVRLIDTNFGEQDTHTTLTYDDDLLPADDVQADRDISNWLRHLRTKCRAQGLPSPEALVVTEHQLADPETGQRAVRYHHHVVLKCGLTRDEIEQCWHRKGIRLGFANADRLRKDKKSLEALAMYLTKYVNRKHRYRRTRGIKDPIMPPARDGKYTRRQIERIAKDPSRLHSADFWARKYPGWSLIEAKAVYSDFLGWSISLRLYRDLEDRKKQKNGHRHQPPGPRRTGAGQGRAGAS